MAFLHAGMRAILLPQFLPLSTPPEGQFQAEHPLS